MTERFSYTAAQLKTLEESHANMMQFIEGMIIEGIEDDQIRVNARRLVIDAENIRRDTKVDDVFPTI